MNFRYRTHQINDIVRAAKVVRDKKAGQFKAYKEHGKYLGVELDLKDGMLVNLRLIVEAGRFDDPETYRAALLLDDQRIRGVDYVEIEIKRFYKIVVPKGWHQNVVDPNLPTREINHHVPLDNFKVADLNDFLGKIAALWHIDLAREEVLL
jgi:hypothetical protein